METNPCSEVENHDRECCYPVMVTGDNGEPIFARVHGERPTDEKTKAAIEAVVKAAYGQLASEVTK